MQMFAVAMFHPRVGKRRCKYSQKRWFDHGRIGSGIIFPYAVRYDDHLAPGAGYVQVTDGLQPIIDHR
jgi:hypothetical protein